MIIDIGQPQSDELEITTLGPGPSKGESIIIHLLDNEWIIIDSCKVGEEVLPLKYLKSIGVNCEKQVSKVICTHWHSDHIQGMHEILSECKNAQFYLAPVGDFKGYLNVVLKLAGINPLGSNIWNILNNCLTALETINHRTPHLLTHNERFVHVGEKEMFAIGPSDEMYSRFLTSLVRINPDHPNEADIEKMEGNLCSLALSISFNGLKALIGGDMEVGRKEHERYNHHVCDAGCPEHEECGWCDAISQGNVFADEKPYHFVKLPHHSSASSYCPMMWNDGMVKDGPLATTTTFKCGTGEDLPTHAMLELYKNRCKELYITNSDVDKETEVFLEGMEGVEVLDQYTEHFGAIICRRKSIEDVWTVRCYGKATLVDDKYMESYHSSL